MAGPTIFDVARRAGVSKSTVSKVLTEAPHVSQAARERVEAAIVDLRYHPNTAARRLQSQRSRLIGLAFPKMEARAPLPVFFSAFLSGAGAVAGRHAYDVVWLVSAAAQEHHDGYARAYLRREVDGLLLTNMLPSDPRVGALQRTECPFVNVGRYDHDEVYTVDVDNVAVGYLATRHLLALGHTRIALLNGPRERLFCQDRYAGYARAMQESGVVAPQDYASWHLFSQANGYEATRRLLSLRPRPTALIVTDTAVQSGCLRALQEAHLHVPADCSLVGVANAQPPFAEPTITAVVQPVADLAAAATLLLLQIIAGERPTERHQVLQPLFVEGRSTAPPR